MSTRTQASRIVPQSRFGLRLQSARKAKMSGAAKTLVAFLVVLAAIVGLWQLMYSRQWVATIVLPSPGQVWDHLIQGTVGRGYLLTHIWTTTEETLIAFVLGVISGVAMGAVFAFVPLVRRAVYPFVLTGLAFPKIAVAPLFVVWLGYGLSPKIAIGASIAFFPALTNSAAGLADISPDELELFRSMRASRFEELRLLRIPRAVSYILPSLDLAIIGALLGVIAGEFVGARSGLGYIVQQYAAVGDSADMYAALFCMAAVGLVLKGATNLTAQLGPKNTDR